MITDKYVNPFTDFGFKKLFGEESSKPYLIHFLNSLLPENHQIANLDYLNPEHQGGSELQRKAIFDLHCVSEEGEHFIVELQRVKQNYFKDRSLFYSTFPIQQQAIKGEWDFKLAPVYSIGILDFVFEEDFAENKTDIVHNIQLKNDHNRIFYKKLKFIYLTLPNFKKIEDELETLQDKWFYIFRNLQDLQELPNRFKDQKIFASFFEKAQIAKFNQEELLAYESSLKYYRDIKNSLDTAKNEGRIEGLKEGLQKGLKKGLQKGLQKGLEEGLQKGLQEGAQKTRQETALRMLQAGLSDDQVMSLTQITQEELFNLKSS